VRNRALTVTYEATSSADSLPELCSACTSNCDWFARIPICMQNNPIQSKLIQSKIICVLRDSNSRASVLCRRATLLTTEPFCHDTDSLWHKYIAWFLKRQRTCQMKTRNQFCCVCTTGACVNNFPKFPNQIYMSVDLEQTLTWWLKRESCHY